MKRSKSGLPTAQLLGCAVAFLGPIVGSALPAVAADPRDAVAACVRSAPQRANPAIVGACMRTSGYDPDGPSGPQAMQCIVERYPGGDLGECLSELTPAATASPLAQTAAALATDARVAQAPGEAPTENPPNGSFSTAAPTAAPTQPPVATAAPTPLPTESEAPPPLVAGNPAQGGDLAWWPLGVAFLIGALMAGAITYFAIRTEPERPAEEGALSLDGTLPSGVHIATPNDFSIHACDAPITLSANVVPPERANDLVWTIVSPENRTVAQGIGAQFTFTATFTGVYHVVARLDKAADDLLLFIYKTPSGGTRLTDLLQAELPPYPREPTSFVWNRSRTL